MAYVLPQVEVFQDFQTSPSAAANPLQAHISGPNAKLLRFAVADEQTEAKLGTYDPALNASYPWPGRPAGGKVDQSYTKLWVKNAILNYFNDNTTVTRSAVNKITSDAINFVSSGEFDRDASLNSRDAAVGDVVKAVFTPGLGGDPVLLWTYIKGFAPRIVDSSIAVRTIDTDNPATNGSPSAASSEQTHGPFNAVHITALSQAAYDPYPTGQTTETYTVVVTQSSVGGDHTTAKLRILSASGLDDVEDVTPSNEGTPTNIGTHGATATFNDNAMADASASAEDAGISANDLIAGQRWQVVVHANYTRVTVANNSGTNSGVYTGAADTTYIVEVVDGNKFATGAAKIKVTTTTGSDISGPTSVSTSGQTVAIGTKGLTMTFTGVGLLQGDRYYVEATADAEAEIRTIILGHSIPGTIADGDACALSLYIRKAELQVTENRTGFAPFTNFDQSETEITVNSDIVAYDEDWYNTTTGAPIALDLAADEDNDYSTLYVEARYWLQDLCNEVNGITDVGTINDQIPGPLDPDNPLKWGVFKALSNSNGVEVMFTSVCDPDDDDSWVDVLELLLGTPDVYGLVPLTRKRTVLDAFAAHATAQSSPEQGLWRVAWFNLQGLPTIPVVSAGSDIPGYTTATTSDGDICKATITDDPDTTGTQYTILLDTEGNGKFITNGVRAGDIVRAVYTGDGFGNFTYSEFVVDEVTTENQLRLLAGPGSAVNVAAKIEIWRNLTATEESAAIADTAGSWANRRIRAVWPDQIESAGTVQEGYHLCAALSGLSSGIVPHQGMTNLEIGGFSAVPRTTSKFNRPQLDTMAGKGTWIVTQDRDSGAILTRHALTTGDYDDINQREEMITRNVDSISFRFKDTFAPFIGVCNTTDSMLAVLRYETKSLITVLKNEKFSEKIGAQLNDATIVDLRRHLTLKDRFVLTLDVDVPAPFNNFEVHLVI